MECRSNLAEAHLGIFPHFHYCKLLHGSVFLPSLFCRTLLDRLILCEPQWKTSESFSASRMGCSRFIWGIYGATQRVYNLGKGMCFEECATSLFGIHSLAKYPIRCCISPLFSEKQISLLNLARWYHSVNQIHQK